MRVIRIYRWRCTDRAIEPLARHDVRCAKGPSLLAISLIYSGICWQGKNADTPFATVNPEGQASPRRFRSSRSEEHTSELQSQSNLVCRLLLEKKKTGPSIDCDTQLNHPYCHD